MTHNIYRHFYNWENLTTSYYLTYYEKEILCYVIVLHRMRMNKGCLKDKRNSNLWGWTAVLHKFYLLTKSTEHKLRDRHIHYVLHFLFLCVRWEIIVLFKIFWYLSKGRIVWLHKVFSCIMSIMLFTHFENENKDFSFSILRIR